MNYEPRDNLEVGAHVAFRQNGLNFGVITEHLTDAYRGRPMVKIKGTCGSKGATVPPHMVVRIAGPDEVIVKASRLADLERIAASVDDGVTGE